MTQLFANNAYSSLAANASNSTTTLTLTTGTGARFPSPTGGNYFLLTLVGLDGNANESSWEIVKVTARSTDTLTVVRAQEGTTAVAWNTGTRVESRATAGTFSDWNGNTIPIAAGGTGATTVSAARTALGLAIGTNVQAWDADLDAIAALVGTTGFLKKTAANTWTLDTSSQTNWDTAYADRNKWDGGPTGLVAATARTSLGLVVGTNVQAWDADLDAIAALAGTSGFLKKTATNTWTLDTTTYESTANKGAANGYAPLGADSKIASTYLPSYVDDVIEGANLAALPGTGETGKIYVALDTNKTYRWSGSAYVEISPSPGSTDSVTEGSVNLYFTNARAVTALSGTLASYAPLASPTFTGSIKGDFSNATLSNRLSLQTSTANSATAVGAIPSGTGNSAAFNVFNSSDPANAGYLQFLINATEARLYSGFTGTGATLPMTFHTGGSERMRVSAAGNVGIGKSAPDQLLQLVGGNIDLQEQVAGRRIGFYVGDSYTTGTVGNAVATARYGLTFGSYVGSSLNISGWGGLTFSTTDLERLRITNAGEIGIGGANYGTAGQVLTSGGSGAAVSWSSIAGGNAANNIGYLNIPQNSQSAAYTCVLSDSGKHIFHPSTDANARTFTIPANGSVAYPIGTAISFVNMTSQVVSIAITTDTMYLAGTGTTGTRSLAQYGTATALKMTSTTWIISGAGLT